MLASYFPVLVFILVGLAAGVLFILLGTILGPKRHYAEKDAAYECGFEAFENARMKFDVRYYLVAILFIYPNLVFTSCHPLESQKVSHPLSNIHHRFKLIQLHF